MIRHDGMKLKERIQINQVRYTPRFYYCPECGSLILNTKGGREKKYCCGKPMLTGRKIPHTGDPEVHQPVIFRLEGEILVSAGEQKHEMTPDHYIRFIALESDQGIRFSWFAPGDDPVVKYLPGEQVIRIYVYCTVHGLWITEI